MAEAWLRQSGAGLCETESAGLEPGTLKPLVVDAMCEVGIYLSSKTTQTVL